MTETPAPPEVPTQDPETDDDETGNDDDDK